MTCRLKSTIKGNQDKNPEARTEGETKDKCWFWFASHDWLNLLSYTVLDQQADPGGGTAHSRLGSPTSINNQKSAPPTDNAFRPL